MEKNVHDAICLLYEDCFLALLFNKCSSRKNIFIAIFILFILLGFTICFDIGYTWITRHRGKYNGENSTSIAGPTFYNPSQSVCCSGSIYPKGSLCCGNQSYNIDTELCCADVVYPRKYGQLDTGCCENMRVTNGSIYDESKQMCCDGQGIVMNKPGDDQDQKHVWKCCGPDRNLTVYDELTHTCWRKSVINSTDDFDSLCLDGSGNLKRFNATQEICCNNQVHKKIKNTTECCEDKKLFDTNTEKCCELNGSVISFANGDDPSNMECCGEKLINTLESKCCNLKVFNISLNGTVEDYDCCGDDMIPAKELNSCPYFLRPTATVQSVILCNSAAIDVRKQLCCVDRKLGKSSIKDRPNYSTICCGNELFSKKENEGKMCCNGEILDKKPGEECCRDYFELNFFKIKDIRSAYLKGRYFSDFLELNIY